MPYLVYLPSAAISRGAAVAKAMRAARASAERMMCLVLGVEEWRLGLGGILLREMESRAVFLVVVDLGLS